MAKASGKKGKAKTKAVTTKPTNAALENRLAEANRVDDTQMFLNLATALSTEKMKEFKEHRLKLVNTPTDEMFPLRERWHSPSS